MDLKNITVEDLKEKFAAFDKKTLIKFGIGIGAIILFLIIYFAILRPMVNEKKATLEGSFEWSLGRAENRTAKVIEMILTGADTQHRYPHARVT